MDRNDIRAKIFNNIEGRFKRVEIEFNGATVELRQPSLRQILMAQGETDRAKALVNLIVGYCYVPGTDEKVFEDTDADSLLAMPFGEDMVRFNKAIETLTSVDVRGQEKNSATQGG